MNQHCHTGHSRTGKVATAHRVTVGHSHAVKRMYMQAPRGPAQIVKVQWARIVDHMHRTADSLGSGSGAAANRLREVYHITMCAALLLAADAQLFFFVVEPPVVAALAFFSSASRSPLVDIRSASSRSFFRHSESSIFSVRSDPIHIAISIQVAVFAQALESMCGNIAKVIATGISIDFNGGILVGISERMNVAILERGWSTKRLAALKGEALSLSQVSRQFVTTFGIKTTPCAPACCIQTADSQTKMISILVDTCSLKTIRLIFNRTCT